MAPKRLVIVGLGAAGVKLAVLAVRSGDFHVTSIEPKEFFEVPYATVRAVVDPSVADKSLIPYTDIPGGVGTHIRAKAVGIKDNTVVLHDGAVVEFDYLVLCTGSTHSGVGVLTPAAVTLTGRKAELQEAAERIQQARSIVVVGGGPLGIEVCGEVVEKYAGKSVSLIHSGPTLLDGKNPKLSSQLLLMLKKHNVKTFLSDRALHVDTANQVVLTTTGKQLHGDVVIWATGSEPNSGLLALGPLTGSLDEGGHANVDEHLRLKGYPNIFVLGDINNTAETKLGYIANEQAMLTAKNLRLLAAGKTKLHSWKAPLQPKGAMLVSFGKGDGAGHVGSCFCGGGFVSMMKGKDLFVKQVRKELGL